MDSASHFIEGDLSDRAGYAYRLDYRQPVPPPPLSATHQTWLNELLAAYKLVAE